MVYTACRQSEIRAGQWIVTIGVRGGLRHLAIQYVKELGMRIIATAADAGKGKAALVLGFLLSHGLHIHSEVLRITTYGAQGITAFVISAQSYANSPFLLNLRGNVVLVGTLPIQL